MKKKWSTSKKALILAISAGFAYCIAVYIAGMFEKSIDSTNTENFYEFCKWIVGASGVLGTAKVVKGVNKEDEKGE